jgi:hypothetical protein
LFLPYAVAGAKVARGARQAMWLRTRTARQPRQPRQGAMGVARVYLFYRCFTNVLHVFYVIVLNLYTSRVSWRLSWRLSQGLPQRMPRARPPRTTRLPGGTQTAGACHLRLALQKMGQMESNVHRSGAVLVVLARLRPLGGRARTFIGQSLLATYNELARVP